MRRPRISIGILMAVVVVVAVDFAVIRSLITSNVNIQIITPPTSSARSAVTSVSPVLFALGVLPMASVLFLCALINLPRLLWRGESSSFVFGFEVFGWASVFLFILWSALATSLVPTYCGFLISMLEPTIHAYLDGTPDWVSILFGMAFISVTFSLPELLVALFGGWLTRRLGITMIINWRRTEECPPAELPDVPC